MIRPGSNFVKISAPIVLICCLFLSVASGQKEVERVGAGKPPDKPAQPLLGSLVITSDPPDVEIFINNERYGATREGQMSKPIMLKPGHYTMVARQNEYEDFHKEVNIKA